MNPLAILLGWTSGIALMRLHRDAATMIGTALAVDAALAPITAIAAVRRGRSGARWTILGFALGAWALAFVLIFKPRAAAPAPAEGPNSPSASDAA